MVRALALVVLVVLVVLVACGPSLSDVKTARSTTYKADPQRLFELCEEAARQQTYKIKDVDAPGWRFITRVEVLDSDGHLETVPQDHPLQVVQFQFIVQLVITGEVIRINVTPQVTLIVAGQPKPRVLAPDDPNMPESVTERADALALAIHERAKAFTAK